MPRICSFYNPSFCCCRMSYVLYPFFFSTMMYVSNVSSFDRFSLFLKNRMLYQDIHRFCLHEGLWTITLSSVSYAGLHVRRICRRNDNNRQTMEYYVGLSVSTWRLVPISPLSVGFGPTYYIPPKGALTDTLSRACHFHPMPLRSS
jgi:hypothetical protein